MHITGQQRQIFDQGELLDILEETYGNLAEEKETVDSIHGGICYMLSIEWLLRLLEEPDAYPDSIYDTNYRNPATLSYYKQIANNYFKYAADYDYTFQGRAGHAGAEASAGTGIADMDRNYVEYCSRKKYTVRNACRNYNAATDITGGFAGDCALLVFLDIEPNNPRVDEFGHEMALWRHGGQSYFYDPNEGVFLLPDFSLIVGEIINGYTALVPGGARARISITQIN